MVGQEDISRKHWNRQFLKCKFVAESFLPVRAVRARVAGVLKSDVLTGKRVGWSPMSGYGDFYISGPLYWILSELISAARWVFLVSLNYAVGRDTDLRYRFVSTSRMWKNNTHIISSESFWEGYSIIVAGFVISFCISGLLPFKKDRYRSQAGGYQFRRLSEIPSL